MKEYFMRIRVEEHELVASTVRLPWSGEEMDQRVREPGPADASEK